MTRRRLLVCVFTLWASAVLVAITGSDDFERADTNTLGGNWTIMSPGTGGAALGIASGKAIVDGAGSADLDNGAYYTGSWANDQSSSVVMTFTDNAALAVRVYARASGTTSATAYYCQAYNGDFYSGKLVADTFTDNTNQGGTPASGQTLSIEVTGTTIKCKVDGVQVGSDYPDATIASGSPGFGLYGAAGGTSVAANSWSGADIGGGSPSGPPAGSLMLMGVGR